MAATRTRGCIGVVYAKDLAVTGAATQVFGVSSWDFAETADQLDASEIGDCTKIQVAGAVETSGTLNLWWDTATGAHQGDLTVANTVALEIYPAGATSGATKYATPTGGAVITDVTRNGGFDTVVNSVVSFSVIGAMATSAVP